MSLRGARLHFVGAGGAGMCGLAELAAARGAVVTASDAQEGASFRRLRTVGVETFPPGHRTEHVRGAAVVVYTSACAPDHVELTAARAAGARLVRRAEFLAECARGRRLIAVAGAHGKTTTTAMIGAALTAAGLDPTVVVGGALRATGSNVRVSGGAWFVAEADEYDRSFLALTPEIAVVNNLDREHLDVYRDMDDLRAAFAAFASKAGPSGRVLLGVDDAEARALRGRLEAPTSGFGTAADADVRAVEVRLLGAGATFRVVRDGVDLGAATLRVPGVHNVRNAAGALAAALAAGAPFAPAAAGLAAFDGVGRRFEELGERDGVRVVDDYAHHPTEIAATLAAARAAAPERRLVAVFQPHLFSRTRDLAADFAAALSGADAVILAPIYGAREAPLDGVTSSLVAAAPGLAGVPTTVVDARPRLLHALRAAARPGDLLLLMGAGDLRAAGEAFAAGREEEGE
ncbi:MAG TPA: UDP-N-acetylmuramate--L-alanine ligase [Planctomycetota bacterium]|nr:UDP-N-acetylmuramate--L-alanine ligase [Planctomycetota bacterium]